MQERDFRTIFDSSDDDSLPDTGDGRLPFARGTGDVSEVAQPNPPERVSVEPGYLDGEGYKRTLWCTPPVVLPIEGVPFCTIPYEWGMFFSAEDWMVRIPTIQSSYSLELVNVLGEIKCRQKVLLWICENGIRTPRYVGFVNVE